VRVPDHSVAWAVVAAAGGALAVTSANRSGGAAATTADAVAAELGGGIDLLLDGGDAIGGVASTVAAIGEDGPRVLRLGAVTAHELAVAWAGGVGAVLPR
jgi:L-threonylcarbamoyladenylate synthase